MFCVCVVDRGHSSADALVALNLLQHIMQVYRGVVLIVAWWLMQLGLVAYGLVAYAARPRGIWPVGLCS